MTYGTVQANAIQGSINTFSPNSAVFRNRIINGAMVIDQRNAGASVTISGSRAYYIDRWNASETTDGSATIQRVTDAPSGFTNSLKITITSADTSLGATQVLDVQQRIEGNNIADLGWGTASAKTVTLSFWVKSSLTGTFGGAFTNDSNRSYPFTYSISVADTWEYKTITVAGDTSGTWATDNSKGILVNFGLGVGSTYSGTAGAWAGSFLLSATGAVSVVGTNGATFFLTGVQLEVGSTATSFDYRPYGTELALCQRYCNVYGENIYSVFGTMAWAFSGTGFSSITEFPVEMRVMPTVAYTGNTRAVSGSESIAVTSATFNTSNSSKKIALVEPSVASGLTTNRGYAWSANNDATARVIFSAEL